jgi:rhodanese-related sulfurtransferase
MREVNVEELEQVMADGATVVDVREPREFAEAHVPGATLIPMSQLTSRLGNLDKDEPVYLICRTGNRSGAMSDVLAANGFDAVNVAGGTLAWVRAGKPFERGVS